MSRPTRPGPVVGAGTERLARWMYRGIWSGLIDWFRLPAEPPSLPVQATDRSNSFQPGPGYLAYLKF